MKRWFVFANGEWIDTIDCLWYLDEDAVKQVAIEWYGHPNNVSVIRKG